MERLSNFIAGESTAPRDRRYSLALDPATGAPLAEVPSSSLEDAESALAAAAQSFPWWSARTPAERSAVLLSLANAIEQRASDFHDAARSAGLPLALAREVELPRALGLLRFYATKILHREEPAQAFGEGGLAYRRRAPRGPLTLLAPPAASLSDVFAELVPAFAAGNTVVLRAPAGLPLPFSRLADLLNEAGLAPGSLNLVYGTPELAGRALAPPPATAFFVWAGADLAAAALAAVRATTRFQERSGPLRVYVEEGARAEFREKFLRTLSLVRTGDPAARETQLGPLPSAAALTTHHAFLERARAAGAELLGGGEPGPGPGFFAEPAVVAGPAVDADCAGPVACLEPMPRRPGAPDGFPADAVVSLWAADALRAGRYAATLPAGSVTVNGPPARAEAFFADEKLARHEKIQIVYVNGPGRA